MSVYKSKWRIRMTLNGRSTTWFVSGTKREAQEFEAARLAEASAVNLVAAHAVPNYCDACPSNPKEGI